MKPAAKRRESHNTRLQAIKVVNMIKLFGKPIRVNKASQEKRALDVGANLFIGNLDPDVDEKMLYDTFSAFGVIAGTPKIMRDPDSGMPFGLYINLHSNEPARILSGLALGHLDWPCCECHHPGNAGRRFG